MKQIKKMLLIIFSASSLLYSCSGNNSAAINKDSTSSPASSTENSPASSKGNASFSCVMGGKDFSGNGTDGIANSFVNTAPGVINFVLVPMTSGGNGIPSQLNFFVANKGVTTIQGEENESYSVSYREQNSSHNWVNKEMTVSISSSDVSRIKGTFSGNFIDANTNELLPVTNGKFDLPYLNASGK